MPVKEKGMGTAKVEVLKANCGLETGVVPARRTRVRSVPGRNKTTGLRLYKRTVPNSLHLRSRAMGHNVDI